MKKLTLKGFLKKTRGKDENYRVKHLGTVLCSHPDKDEICRAMAEMYTVSRQKIKKLPLYNLTVSSREITLQKVADAKENSVKKFVITRIVYCGVDKQHRKIFAFFYRSAESIYGALNCHVVECRSKGDARQIALMISEIFEEMANEKREETQETSASSESTLVQERTLSMVQLHMSVESLFEDEKEDRCGSPTLQRSKPNESRKLNYSDLQLHLTKCENNSSGYGDSSEHLSNDTVKMIKQRRSAVQVHNDGGECSQTGQVKMDYVNAEIAGSSSSGGLFKRNSASISKTFGSQTVGFTKIKECGDTLKKDRNANLFEYKTFEHKYMNIDTRSDKTGEFV